MNMLLLARLFLSLVFLDKARAVVPVGVNLSPLGGQNIGGLEYADVNWNPISTTVFTDIYKHCGPLYIRQVYN